MDQHEPDSGQGVNNKYLIDEAVCNMNVHGNGNNTEHMINSNNHISLSRSSRCSNDVDIVGVDVGARTCVLTFVRTMGATSEDAFVRKSNIAHIGRRALRRVQFVCVCDVR